VNGPGPRSQKGAKVASRAELRDTLMRNYRVYLALLVVFIAIVGAILHPVALILGWAPFDTRGLVGSLVELRSLIADLLGWTVLSLLAVMVGYVVRGRLEHRAHRVVEGAATTGERERAANPRAPSRPKVVVALTAYNDAVATAQDVKDFRRQPDVVKVLVIDNNSSDNTAELAAAAGATVIRETRQGYGYACIRGLSEGLRVPDADVIVLCEGDGSFVADDIAKFLAYANDADLVVGNRVVRGLVDHDSQMDHFFIWGNMAVAMLLRLRFWDGRHLGPAGLTDVGCTFRAIRRPALERILPDLVVGGSHFSPHMILVAMSRDLSVIEIPIRLRRRIGQSKGASQSMRKGLVVGIAMIWHIMSFSLKPDSPPPSAAANLGPASANPWDGHRHPKLGSQAIATAPDEPTSAGISR
jgi:membrane protein implicated in regulation of membrane protease activity